MGRIASVLARASGTRRRESLGIVVFTPSDSIEDENFRNRHFRTEVSKHFHASRYCVKRVTGKRVRRGDPRLAPVLLELFVEGGLVKRNGPTNGFVSGKNQHGCPLCESFSSSSFQTR